MPTNAPDIAPSATWEEDVRALEEKGRLAFLAADIATLDAMWSDDLVVNSPLNIINDKARVSPLRKRRVISPAAAPLRSR